MANLFEARFIYKIDYLDWLANVMVKLIKLGKWSVYVDFTNLNKAFLKDRFLLLWIIQIVDVTIKDKMLSFIDGFFGYNQIPVYPPDLDKTTFITPQGL